MEPFVPQLQLGFFSDIGLKRDLQEDCIGYGDLYLHPDYFMLAREKGNLYVLADGAGGHEGGNVASELAVLGILDIFYRPEKRSIEEALEEAILEASDNISAFAERTGIPARSTVVCAVIRGHELYVANVGDSRAYLIRNGEAIQLSQDHSLVGELVHQGKITKEQARVHPQRNVVTQALGGGELASITLHWEELLSGDIILLCSDGVHGILDDTLIARIISREANPQVACEELVDQANGAGGSDNSSVILIHVEQLTPGTSEHFEMADATAPPTFARGGDGVITLCSPATSSRSARQIKHGNTLFNRFSAFFDRRSR